MTLRLPLIPTLLLLPLLAAAQSPKTVPIDHRVFPGLAAMDGAWAALLAASDGKVYAGLAYHGGGGHMVYYDSKSGRMVDVGDLTQLAGESDLRRGPQSKIHAKFGEGSDRRIYFGTHGGFWWDYARFGSKEGYPGAHWMSFDPSTGRVQDFGIGTPNEGINTGAYDPKFHRIYGLTHPRGHFIYFDVTARRTVDKGRINNSDSICRTLGIDGDGNVYGTFGAGQIFKYDAAADTLRDLDSHVPFRPKGVSLGRDYLKSESGWRSVIWDRETGRFYGVDESATLLFSFDPKAGKDGEVRELGQLCIPEFRGRRDVPFATLSLALGHDRKLYYGAAANEFDYSASGGVAASHLTTYDLATGQTVDLGEMRLSDGRRVLGTNAADTGPDGTVYMLGALELGAAAAPGEAESAGTIGGVPYRLALLMYHPAARTAKP